MTETAVRPVPVLLEGGPAEPPPVPAARRPSGPARLLASARAVPGMGTWIGLGLSVLGVVVLVYGWGKVAGLTSVALQLPYVASAGVGGLALVALGLTIVNVAAKQAEAAERTRQLGELRDLLAELRRTVEEDR